MKKITIFISIICSILILSGCGDKKEVEEISHAIAIGLDIPTGIDLEENQALDVTFQFANPKLNIKGGPTEEKDPNKNILTLTAPDFVTAKNTANSSITRQISFNHTKAIVVSEELAKTDIFYNFLSTVLKEREVRRETSIIVSEGKASEFIRKNEPELMIRSHKYYQFIIDRSIETGLVPKSDLNRFFAITDGDADLFLAIYGSLNSNEKENSFREEDQYLAGHVPKKGGNPIQLIGSAVFKEGKMIAKLTGEETRISLLLDNTSKIEDIFVSYVDPLNKKSKIAARLKKKNNAKVKIKLRNGPPKINVTVPLELEILSIPSLQNYANNLEKQKLLKNTLESEIKKNMDSLIEKTQNEFKSEPFYWSLYVRPFFDSVPKYEKWDWTNKNYPFADIEVAVNLKITGFGKQLKESQMKEVRD